ncbi:hypothetical protein TIFTF001_005742 [Ficus carica]|uniref:Myb/SANT-like domain-containing protein n=1 Tax=Ficus carica TaxID=3494 RepID=A0AA87ZKH3_FICCA|nr:hypothetical protein TIFTF001_005742 [Ficus carica]
MPRKASGETYVWDNAKEKKFLQQLDDYLACSGGRHPPKAILDLWATQFNAEFGGQTGLGYDASTDRVICSDEAWQSFIQVFKECNYLRHKRLRYKELYSNVLEKSHAAGASGYGLVTMRDDSTTYVGHEGSMDNSGNHDFDDDLMPTTGKRKQRDETDEMTFIAMQEIVSHFRGQSGSGPSNDTSSRTDHMLMWMTIMSEMGIAPNQRCLMWHYFDYHPRLQRTFY